MAREVASEAPPTSGSKAQSAVEVTPAIKKEPNAAENVLDFLRSRPQVAAMQQTRVKNIAPAKKEPPRSLDSKVEAEDLVENLRYRGNPDTWQEGETINDFLRRAPVDEATTADLGPWLWVHSPTIRYHQEKHGQKQDLRAFEEGGSALLKAFVTQQAKIESDNPEKAPATITRYMRPYREQLEDDVLSLAVKTGTMFGKWMLFPGPEDLPRYWRLVAEATSEGKLGPTCKVATPDPFSGKKETLICVYTYNFVDNDDVRRVLDELIELGVCRADGKPIY